MKISQLHKLHKQLGNKVIECKDGNINGYAIKSYRNYEPLELELEVTKKRPDSVTSWDTAYDMLYGPLTAPDFTKALEV